MLLPRWKVWRVILWACIREVSGYNLVWVIDYPDWGYSLFSSTPPGKFWHNTSIKQRQMPSKFLPAYYPPITLPSDSLKSVKLTASCNKQQILGRTALNCYRYLRKCGSIYEVFSFGRMGQTQVVGSAVEHARIGVHVDTKRDQMAVTLTPQNGHVASSSVLHQPSGQCTSTHTPHCLIC